MRRRIIMVETGQRYVQRFQESARKEIWEVASISSDTMQIQHARLFKVSDRTDTKTLSCLALDGKHGFSPTNQ